MTVDLNDLGSTTLRNESDVEQKLIYPLLTAQEWLALPERAVFSKKYLPPATIDKGSGRKTGYFPDYSVWLNGFPVLIVEAKSPLEEVGEGFREAQLYAHEVNKAYPTGIAPIQTVMCTNGKVVRVGSWDSHDHRDYPVTELQIGSSARSELIERLGTEAMQQQADRTSARFRPTQTFRPINAIGGDPTLNRRLDLNSFATDIAPLIRMFFVSDSAEKIDDIIRRAYVSTNETTKYDTILESFLRDNIKKIQDPAAKPISTTANREELLTPELRRFQQNLPATGHMQLIIGSVGSGKSLFCRRYQRFLQPEDVKNSTYWTFVDFNTAPENLNDIETWMCRSFVQSFQDNHPEMDLDDPETLERIFAPDVNRTTKLYRRAGESEEKIRIRVAEALSKCIDDPQKFSQEICRYINGDQSKVVVVVFDNVDKLDSGDQIRVFQAAQWFRAKTRSFCLLPLRDETYERYKNRPPLDAFINAIHFTIEPPRFIDVVRKRLELCLEYIANSAPKTLSYSLPDGKKITYPATRLGEFLKTLYLDIFRSGRRISWLLEALAGRDVRHALEMFTRIIMSGHLDERHITGTVLGTEKFRIRDSTIINVLMKSDYVYFDNSHGFLSNVLYANPKWSRHSNFLVFEILDYLVKRRKEVSPLGAQGYFRVSDVISYINRLGFAPDDALDALNYLVVQGLLTPDHFGKKALNEEDFVRAHASGFVHSRLLLENIHYVAGIAPVTYLNDRNVSEKIGRLSLVNAGFSDTQFPRKKEIGSLLLEYLKSEFNRQAEEAPLFANLATSSRFLIRMIESSLDVRFRELGTGIEGGLL
ncbi:hypothetical protein J2792_004231 [Novosphingobium capsulatum]|uniref:Restriction endonuclease type I HsdR N-terminal domain-containing protein n=1 Tax=Novosphingobium capsulatum TaxID=13688 RepID=A0ABU1MU24_9SPHN|nr:type I restriction enzyme HsdR N-terminal domain-containing protein [Novosphingobium capsulatum]MDR6513337.1 hypothetical protein [Novosphingobium capsulatum]